MEVINMLNLNSIMMGTLKFKEMASFYEKVIGKKPEMKEDEWVGWQVGASFFGVGVHSEMKGKAKDPGRIMFNLETKDVKGEFARVKKIGAVVIKEPYDMGGAWVATFADPDGNYFQLMTPWESK